MTSLGSILAMTAICFVCKAIIFARRDIKSIWAFIPFINRYKLGKLTGSKRLAILHTILHPLFIFVFCASFGFELWIIKNYSYAIQIPEDGIDMSKIQVAVPQDIATFAVWSKYLLIFSAAIDLVVWCIMMWKFTIQHDKNPWWILLWAVIPAIPYATFAASSTVVIDGKRYTTKRIEVNENKSKKEKCKKEKEDKPKKEKFAKIKVKLSRKKNGHESKESA